MAKEKNKPRSCADCPMRKKTEENPASILSKIWRWHTGWRPGWRAYQASLAEEGKS